MKRDDDFVRELSLVLPMYQSAPAITPLNNYIFVVTFLT